MSESLSKPPIIKVLQALGASLSDEDYPHGWKPIRCPFHGDSQASASYNTILQRFRCHGCGIAGDGYDVIGQVERCDFQSARARVAELCGVALTEPFTEGASPGRSRLTSRKTKERSRLVRSKYRRRTPLQGTRTHVNGRTEREH